AYRPCDAAIPHANGGRSQHRKPLALCGDRVTDGRAVLARFVILCCSRDSTRFGTFDRGQEPSRHRLLRRSLGLDLRKDRLHEVRVLREEGGSVLASLTEPLVTEAEV